MGNEFATVKTVSRLTIDMTFLWVFIVKFYLLMLYLNEYVVKYVSDIQLDYMPNNLVQDVSYNQYLSIHGDVAFLIGLYSTNYFLIILLGLIMCDLKYN
jgi:hypothetical protein